MAEENILLKILPGETRQEAIERWWQENGFNHEVARRKRNETYRKQKDGSYYAEQIFSENSK